MYNVRPITDKHIWDDFIRAAKPNTFLHAWAWGQAEADTGRTIYRLGVFDEKEKLLAVALGVIVRARRGSMLLCPHGPIIAADASKKESLSLITTEFITIGKKEHCDVVRICPIIADTEEHREIFRGLGFRNAPIHVYSEYSWILDITPSEEILLRGMKKNTRYGIRKAERDGITVSLSSEHKDFEIFWDIYRQTAERQSFVPFPRKLVEAEFKRFAEQGCVRLYFAHYEGKAISTAFIVYGPASAFYHHGASLHMHASITPGELLQWTIIQDAKTRGLVKYDFWGVVPEHRKVGRKEHAWAHLDHFKKGFGGAPEAYVHAQDYPLSWKYLITYAIETIRKWKRNV